MTMTTTMTTEGFDCGLSRRLLIDVFYGYYAAQLLFFLIGTYLPTFSSVIRHVMGLHDKFEVDRRLKSLRGLRSHME